MSPTATYRHLFSLAGPTYVVVAFLGRLPMAMSQLGILLLVAGSTGSFAAGGASAGALAVAAALSAPLSGVLADRLGQRIVVLVQSLAGAAGLVAVVALSAAGAAWEWQAVAAAAAGLVLPQVGPLARVRWRPIAGRTTAEVRSSQLVSAAFSYEGAADEASYVLGPALVGVVAALLNPAMAILVAAAMLAVFGTLFAIHPTAALVAGRPSGLRASRVRLPMASLAVLVGAQLVVGSVFGSVQTGTSVLATDAGVPGMTGLLHALLGVGSVLAGLAVAMLPARITLPTRLVVFASALIVLTLPLHLVDSLPSLAIVLLLMGLAIAPYMITVFTLAERITPDGRVGSVMTMLAGVTGLGYAIGSSVGGRLADTWGYSAAFAVPVGAAVVATVLVAGAFPMLSRTENHGDVGSLAPVA